MILSKIIYDIKESLKEYTDYSELDNRYIIHLFNIKRAKYLRQQLNDLQRTIDLSITQTFCEALEEVSINECNLDFVCGKILRTKRKIPQALELHLKPAITAVKPTNITSLPFNFLPKERALYHQFSPFKNSIYSFLNDDGYIYLISENKGLRLIECITVSGIFEDPLELSLFNNCCGCETPSPCFDINTTNYPLQPHYIDLIKAEIVTELVYKYRIPEDKTNNSEDDKEFK